MIRIATILAATSSLFCMMRIAAILSAVGSLLSMVRVAAITSAAGVKGYFERDGYHTEAGKVIGAWRGKATKLLNVSGPVRDEDFNALCDNLKPGSLERLTLRTKDNRRVGYDISFHASKGTSLLYHLTKDQAILDAFQLSEGETMQRIEESVECRVRKGNAQANRVTGNLISANYLHGTARPVNGVPDPHLHGHNFIFNATFDQVEGTWKAGEFGWIKRNAPYFEAYFLARFAERMRAAGYQIEVRGRYWEIAGVSRDIIERFSRRTTEINKLADKLGITDPDQRGQLGAKTRQKKVPSFSPTELRKIWLERLSTEELAALWSLKKPAKSLTDAELSSEARRSVRFAIEHSFERKSVLTEQELLTVAFKHGLGKTTPDGVKAALDEAGLIRRTIDGTTFVTTKEVLSEEKRMLDFAREGRGTLRPLASGPHHFRDQRLNEQQRNAVEHVLGSRDLVVIIRGGAGTGKTTLMTEAISAVEHTGKAVVELAPSADASRGVLRQEGFKKADTVEKFLQSDKLQKQYRGQVLWIDEAGLLGCKTMARVFDFARNNAGTRIVLSGDWRQHNGVERGMPLQLLEDEAGIRPAIVQMIQRQRGLYRTAVGLLATGQVEKGFAALDKLGFIREVNKEEGHRALASDFLEARREGRTVLVVCPTHAEGRKVTAAIRDELRNHGHIGKKGRTVENLLSKGFTEAERKESSNYQRGQVIRFHKPARGFKAGQRTEVVGIDPLGNVWVKGKLVPCILARHQANRFDVFDKSEIELAAKDSIRFTRNGKTADGKHALNNGAIYAVQRITASGDLKLANGWVVSKDFGHFTHGYCVTSIGSQGKTVDRVLVAESSESFGAASDKQFLVSVSRGKESCTIYTDDKQGLLRRVTAAESRPSASELARAETDETRAIALEKARQQRDSLDEHKRERGFDRERD